MLTLGPDGVEHVGAFFEASLFALFGLPASLPADYDPASVPGLTDVLALLVGVASGRPIRSPAAWPDPSCSSGPSATPARSLQLVAGTDLDRPHPLRPLGPARACCGT